MKFPTMYDRIGTQEFVTCAGNPLEPIYRYDVIDGVKTLVPDGFTDIQKEIQSYAESADINNIVSRFLNGDQTVLNQAPGFYADVSSMPRSYAELFELNKEAKMNFAQLDPDIRAAFNDNYELYYSHFGDDFFMEKIQPFIKANEMKEVNDAVEE